MSQPCNMKRGDIVADNQNNFYVVDQVNEKTCAVLYLAFNENRDSVIVKKLFDQPKYDYDLANESLINYAGELAQVANDIKAGKDIMTY